MTTSSDFTDLLSGGTSGLLGLAVDPGFGSNHRLYTCQGHTSGELRVYGWTLDSGLTSAGRDADPLVQVPLDAQYNHIGCRLQIDAGGALWITTGDNSDGSAPQDLTNLNGKVLRVDRVTGEGIPSNPFAASLDANERKIFTYGHRNVQGLAFRPGTNQVWAVEHGPDRDDEINLLTGGGNYGWDPQPGYDETTPMTNLAKFPTAIEAQWSSGFPTLATSGATFVNGDEWGTWDGHLAVAALKDQKLLLFPGLSPAPPSAIPSFHRNSTAPMGGCVRRFRDRTVLST